MSRSSPAEWDVLEFLDAPVWLARRHLWPLLGLVVPARVVAIVPSTLGQALSWGLEGEQDLPRMYAGLALTYGGMFFSWVILTGMLGALTHAVVARLHGGAPTAAESWRFALRPAVAGTALLVGVVTMVGSAMCLVPGLLAATYLALALPVMVEEGLTGGQALDRSVALVRHGKGGPWFTSTAAFAACVSFSYLMIGYAISSLVTLPAGVLGAVVGVRAAASGVPAEQAAAMFPSSLAVVLNLGGALLSGFSDIYIVVALALLYRRARDLLEGADLRAAIAEDR